MKKKLIICITALGILFSTIMGCSNEEKNGISDSSQTETIEEENNIEMTLYEMNGISFEVPNVWNENSEGTSSEDIIGFIFEESDEKRLTVRYQIIPDFMKIDINSDYDILNSEDVVKSYSLAKKYEIIEETWIKEGDMEYYKSKFYMDADGRYGVEYIFPINNNEAVWEVIMLCPEEDSAEFEHAYMVFSSVEGIEFETQDNANYQKISFDTFKNNLEMTLANNNVEIGEVVEADGQQLFKIKSDYGIDLISVETNKDGEIIMLAVIFDEMPAGGLNQYLFSVTKIIQSFDMSLDEENALAIVYDNADSIVNKNGVLYYYDSSVNSLLATVD